ncbi:MAG TPA: hypothetical protein VF210_13985 [Pseudomonadales bacterium]
MLGFDVDIASARNYPVYRFQAQTRRNPKVRKALRELWSLLDGRAQGAGPGSEPAFHAAERERLEKFITPELFQVLAEPERVVRVAPALAEPTVLQPVETPDFSQQAAAQINTEESINAAWSWGKRLGMRLWDGLKRLWRWLRQGVRRILEVGKNLLRGFFRYAMKAFQIVRHAIRSVADGLGQYLRGEIDTGTNMRVTVELDGDMIITIPADTDGAIVSASSARLRYFGAAFRLAIRILVLVLDVIRAAATGLAGWARLLWCLVESYRDIRPLYLELIRLERR